MFKWSLSLVLILGLSAASWAQGVGGGEGIAQGRFELSAGGGGSLPFGDFSDAANTGYLFGASGGYYVTPMYAVGVEFNYQSYGASDEVVEVFQSLTGDSSADFDWSVTQISVFGKYLFTQRNTAPYAKAHLGTYSLKGTGSALGASASSSDSNIGVGGGIGLQFKGQGNVGGFVEGVFHAIFTEGSSTTYASGRAGVTFFLGGN